MQFAVSILLSGISVGGQYALIAIGYTLVYGILRLINFAHGDVFMTAGLILVYASATMPLYVSVPLMIIAIAALGFCIERVAYKPLRSAPRMSVMISAIGVSFLIQNFATYYTGGLPQSYPRLPFLSESVIIYGTSTKWVTIVTPFLVVALVVALQILINKTKIGLAVRAVAINPDTSKLMGIDSGAIIVLIFSIAGFLAGVSGVLLGCKYGVYPDLGQTMMVKGFIASLIGGLGSLGGAIAAAFILGVVEMFWTFGFGALSTPVMTFVLMLLFLFIRPQGIAGQFAKEKV